MVLNQRQVLVVVSDWEPYLGSLGFTVGLWVFRFISLYCFVFHSVQAFLIKIVMGTYRAAFWSDPCYTEICHYKPF